MVTIFYDANCSICTKIKVSLELLDLERALIFRPIQDQEQLNLVPNLNSWNCRKTIHAVDLEGNIYKEEEAISLIFDNLKVIKNADNLYKAPLGKSILRVLYKYLNEYRLKQISDCDDCRI